MPSQPLSAYPEGRHRHVRPVIAASLCALIAVIALVALHKTARSRTSSSGPLITQPLAEKVLAQLWRKREAALANDNESVISAVDTGAALARDLNNIIEAVGQGDAGGRPEPALGRHFVALEQTNRYPYSFLAGVQPTTSTPASGQSTYLLVVTKVSSSSPWRVAMETTRGGSLEELWEDLEELKPGSEASVLKQGATMHVKNAPAWIQPTGALAAVAAYFQHYAEYGGPPAKSPIMPGPWTTQEGHFIAQNDPRYVVNRQGVRAKVAYTPDWQDGIYTFVERGLPITCGTIAVSNIWTPAAPGGYLYQPPSRMNWGVGLAPGAYQSIRGIGEHQICLTVSPTQGAIKVFGGEPGPDGSLGVVSGIPVPRAQAEAKPAAERRAA